MTARVGSALWMVGPRRLEHRSEPVSKPGRRQVLVRALVSGLSHGTEMLAYRGEIDPQVPLDLPTLAGGFGFPLKYGYASVGQVAEAGSEVTDLLPGDRVFCLHPHQDWFAIDADLVVRLPADAPTERGVFCANLETAFNVMLDAPIRLEETVVVFGQGVVGLLVTRLARRAGAGRIVAVEPWPA